MRCLYCLKAFKQEEKGQWFCKACAGINEKEKEEIPVYIAVYQRRDAEKKMELLLMEKKFDDAVSLAKTLPIEHRKTLRDMYSKYLRKQREPGEDDD